MTPDPAGWTDADAAMLDRLVDGELADPARRALLARLDASPDGWKRCALAFLEAQCWREALAEIPAAPALPAPTPGRPARARFRLAAAASMLAAAFALGWTAGAARPGVPGPGPGPASPELTAVEPEAPAGPEEEQGAVRAVGMLRIGPGGVGVPVLAGPGLDRRWLQEQGPSVPEHVRARWERHGYRLEGSREVLEVPLAGGGQVALPVDRVRATYVGLPPA